MKYINLAKKFAVVALCAAAFTSCDKNDDDAEPIGDRGQTVVKLINGGDPSVILWSVDFVNSPQTLLAADLRRDVPNETELNKTMTVVIKDDVAAVAAVDPTLVPLPTAYYTIGAATPKVGGQGGTYTITLTPGKFAEQIYITIPDATVMSTSTTYGLGFTITSVDADGKISASKSIVYKIGAKNAYDGVYKVSGVFTHPTTDYAGPFGTPGRGEPLEVDLVTVGATQVKRVCNQPGWGGYEGFQFWITSGNDLTGFSNVFPMYDVNPATNVVHVYSTNAANTVTWFDVDSKFIPATHSFTMHYYYNAPTRDIVENWAYLRSR
jgi:hypothetical protein